MDEKLREALETPAFRALLVGDFSKRLRIPSAFIKNFGGRSLRKCTLRNPSGDCWGVKLKQKEDGFFFRKGWKVFVKDHFLEHGDFLVFEYGGGSEFDVTIFDRTCCEKNVEEAARRASRNLADSRTVDDVVRIERPASVHLAETSSVLFKSENTWFTKTLKKFNRNILTIPKQVALAEGLVSDAGLPSRETVTLQDPTGRSWLAQLHVRADHRVQMARGWVACVRANEISPGDDIVFEFVKRGVLQLHIFRGNVLLTSPDVSLKPMNCNFSHCVTS